MSSSTAESQKKFNKGRLAAFAFGNFGQSLFYNALSTYFMVFATNALFAGVDKTTAGKLIGIITGLVMVIRIVEIFLDPMLGNLGYNGLNIVVMPIVTFFSFTGGAGQNASGWLAFGIIGILTCMTSPMPPSTARTSPRPCCSARSPQ